ncbi:alpha/beta fold hydrolase [Streptomyces sp. NBC_01485]|uniref:thioesterase II family protein n=1 Tax=Streptomyces sp. NBC_01485 TaxID=2903884 RepID=UPI002E330DA7|nr:alpha/beta fold hydrolase [Streptomyces sp. NBC_01485]
MAGPRLGGADTAGTDAALRLFCFPHAGGGGGFFRPWRQALGGGVDVRPVVLPGREGRFRELPYVTMAQAVGPLTEALRPYLDRPFAFFGHSMGAALAHEVARRCVTEGLPAPRRLFVSARRAPHLPSRRPSYARLTDAQFLDAVAGLEGTPAEVLEQPELVRLFLPALRADFELNDTYAPLPGPRPTWPVTAFLGRGDPEASTDEMAAWAQVTGGAFRLRMFEGGHFYLKDEQTALLREISADLRLPEQTPPEIPTVSNLGVSP